MLIAASSWPSLETDVTVVSSPEANAVVAPPATAA